jgi:non-lysosomal glucosylceramidase
MEKIDVGTRADRRVMRGENLRSVAMPMGGIGAGWIALAGDGGWRQWQTHNLPNHLAHLPHTFFAVQMRPSAVHFTERKRPEDLMSVSRVLMSPSLYNDETFSPAVTSSDHIIPDESRRLLADWPGVDTVDYVGEYPIAELTYSDTDLLLPVRMEAFSPFVPLDEEASGYPAVICRLSVTNTLETNIHVSLTATLQNAVGWDGKGLISGTGFNGYGGNVNRVLRTKGLTTIEMTGTRQESDHPLYGQMALSALHDDVTWNSRWQSPDDLRAELSQGHFTNVDDATPSEPGNTVNGALCRDRELEPGETLDAVFVISWYFPNRYINWDQKWMGLTDKRSKFYIGNRYNTRFRSALHVAEDIRDREPELTARTRAFRDTFYDSTLPYWMLDTVTSQASIIRSPTCMWIEDGSFFAFEGCHGASTGSPQDTGGCCPLNCNHVWNYEMSLAKLFPQLEQSMRRNDLKHQTNDEGRTGHRTLLPTYLPAWTVPATDGQVGTILKLYREWRTSGDRDYFDEMWPHAKRAMEFTFKEWDNDGDGIMEGDQPNTYDCAVHGWSTFTSGLYLAALRAAEEMAKLQDDAAFATECRKRFDSGTKKLDEALWNGRFYIQKPDPEKNMDMQYGTGCHADQVFGQWWAHLLDLGYVFPADHVKTALKSIVTNNFRDDFLDFKQTPRVFASDHDQGLLICSWPDGDKPEKPTLYSDEVWPGIEYEVAGLMLREGLIEEAYRLILAVRSRYNGVQRNPWNEVECGDHYARSMSSWAILETTLGFRHDASRSFIGFAPTVSPEAFRAPFLTGTGWGTYSQEIAEGSARMHLSVTEGSVSVRTIEIDLPATPHGAISVALGGVPASSESMIARNRVIVPFGDGLTVTKGESLFIEVPVRED